MMAPRARIGWKPKTNDPNVASARFRCLTPLEALRAMGWPVEIFDPAARYDLVIFSKIYDKRDQDLARKLAADGIRTILDLSDNHFYNPARLPAYEAAGRNLRAMIACVDRVICCSEALAAIVQEEAAPLQVPLVVGDAVEDFTPSTPAPHSNRIVWFGSHGSPNAPAGMEDLLRIREPLDAFARARAHEIVIVSNNRAKFDSLRGAFQAPMRYVEWSQTAFAAELNGAALVVIPITDNPFTRCKSNNRAATALWHGVPVMADTIPAYEELAPYAVLNDWAGGFAALASDPAALAPRTDAGRSYVRARFTTARIADDWAAAFEAILAEPARS